MTTTHTGIFARCESLIFRAYLATGAVVCGLTSVLVMLGRTPSTVEATLLAAILHLVCGLSFVMAWRRWAGGRGSLRTPQAYFVTFIPFLAVGVAVGSPAGDARVPLLLNVILLAAFLIPWRKEPVKAS